MKGTDLFRDKLQQGEIDISIRTQSMDDDRVELLFCIRNTGIGIAPEVQRKLF